MTTQNRQKSYAKKNHTADTLSFLKVRFRFRNIVPSIKGVSGFKYQCGFTYIDIFNIRTEIVTKAMYIL